MDDEDPAPATDAARSTLLARLAELEIRAPIVHYPEHATVEEGRQRRGALPGVFTKNLLLKDKKGQLFLVAADETNEIDLRSLHTRIGARGRLRFAPSEQMYAVLGVRPGTLTPLAVINDVDGLVTVVLDDTLVDAAQINFHPMVHTESIGLTPAQLSRFLEATAHPPIAATVT